jgi:hypothetical protein
MHLGNILTDITEASTSFWIRWNGSIDRVAYRIPYYDIDFLIQLTQFDHLLANTPTELVELLDEIHRREKRLLLINEFEADADVDVDADVDTDDDLPLLEECPGGDCPSWMQEEAAHIIEEHMTSREIDELYDWFGNMLLYLDEDIVLTDITNTRSGRFV